MGGRSVGCAALSLALLAMGSEASEGAGSARLRLEAKQRKIQAARSDLSKVARAALPAVVSITVLQTPPQDPEAREAASPQQSIGAGFIIHPDGLILTSYHVVDDASAIRVTVNSGADRSADRSEVYVGRIVGRDEQTDVALLKIDARRRLPVLPLGSSSSVQVADWVLVIGSPFGMVNSVTVGVVSYKGRSGISPNGKDSYVNYLQTDAAINPGNSGGPVLNLNGQVVAIANAVNVAGQGIGFAIPIETAKEILPQLRAQGSVRRAWMGASVQDASDVGSRGGEGVLVSEVLKGSPASKAGLQVGDVITSLGPTSIRRADALRWKVATAGVGEWVELWVHRDGQPLRLQVRLEETPRFDEAQDVERFVWDRDAAKTNDSGAKDVGH